MPFPSPMSESESEVAQSCLALSDPMDCSLPGSSAHWIFQARVLEWVAVAFSDKLGYKWLNDPVNSTRLRKPGRESVSSDTTQLLPREEIL